MSIAIIRNRVGGGGSQPEPEIKALIPTMTSNTAPKGVASASSIYNSGSDAFHAFDGNTSATWSSLNSDNNSPYVAYAFPSPVVVKSIQYYNVGSGNASSYGSKFKFQASNDGNTWVDVSDVITQTAGSRVSGTINLDSNKTAYTNYRVVATETVMGLAAFEIQLYGYKLYPEPPFTSEGLTVNVGRCTIDSGGFRLNENVVEVDITFTAQTTLNYRYGIVLGFPTSTTSGDVTSNHNDFCINNTGSVMSLLLNVNKTIPAGTTIRFIGSYTWR